MQTKFGQQFSLVFLRVINDFFAGATGLATLGA
jgi:hypothetical protein